MIDTTAKVSEEVNRKTMEYLSTQYTNPEFRNVLHRRYRQTDKWQYHADIWSTAKNLVNPVLRHEKVSQGCEIIRKYEPVNCHCREIVLNIIAHHRTKMFILCIFQQIQYMHLHTTW